MAPFIQFDPEYEDQDYLHDDPRVDDGAYTRRLQRQYEAQELAAQNAKISTSQAMKRYKLSSEDMAALKCQETVKTKSGWEAKLYLVTDCVRLSEEKKTRKETEKEATAATNAAKKAAKIPGKRGRPRKERPESDSEDKKPPAPKRRGRPPKEEIALTEDEGVLKVEPGSERRSARSKRVVDYAEDRELVARKTQ